MVNPCSACTDRCERGTVFPEKPPYSLYAPPAGWSYYFITYVLRHYLMPSLPFRLCCSFVWLRFPCCCRRFTSQAVELSLQGHPHKGGPTPSFHEFDLRSDSCIEYAKAEDHNSLGFLGSIASALWC